jgi:hypothetical protein
MWHTCRPYVLRGAFAFLEPEHLWPTESAAGHGWHRARRLRRVVWKVFLAGATDFPRHFPSSGHPKKVLPPPVAPDESTPYRPQVRGSFGAFGANENGYAQAIDRYRDFARKIRCNSKSSEPGSEGDLGNFRQEKRPYKSCTCRPMELDWS